MPLTQISLRKGTKTNAQKAAIMNELYRAMRETIDVPDDDKFMTISEFEPEDFVFGRHYMDIARSDDLLIIQLTISDTRPWEKKRALLRRIADGLEKNVGVRPEDIFVNLVETKLENWSLGHGIAQYVEKDTAA
ncbi:tautomerase family protein [Roseibium sp. MMSF_3544]|uniref:tautomerase family protein n=1 Tax=unclassified Roseibium TaxID=2629323 RepID=UPI00273F4D5D|nr:tautomerase family protein [Roseibium sp. MMSF_3544]